MASISTDKQGNRVIQFKAADGKRRSIRLGKMPLKAVREVKSKVEAINSAAVAGISLDRELVEWLGKLKPTLYEKLVGVGLVQSRAAAPTATLKAFIDQYMATRTDIKPSTRTNLEQVTRNLVEFFGANKPLADVTEGHADEFRLWMLDRLGENTVRRHCGRARQFFRAAVKRRLIQSNPFGEMKGIAVLSNPERLYFVPREDAQKVIEACPDAQWRLLFALSRYGGLRCPSEHLALKWSDVNWDRETITIHSPKTEHIRGQETRVIPMFPELRKYLDEVWDQAETGTEYVITRYRDANANLRTQLERIIKRAGLETWPKLFQNLRSTRETELAESYPIHVVCKWIGNSEAVAKRHYLQLTDEHHKRAVTPEPALQNPVHSDAGSGVCDTPTPSKTSAAPANFAEMRHCTLVNVPPQGLEP